jgi:lipoprotein-releasing system permease protein
LPKNEEILIGSQLAKHLNLYLYDKVKVISPVERKHFEFKIGGIFESGMYDYDATLTYISLNKAKEFFDTGGLIGTIGVRVDDLFLAEEVKKSLIEELGFGYWIKTWMEINKNLFSSLKLEKTVMFIILVLIVLVACFNIISTLIMTVMEKTKDIGILKSLGATRSSIASVFTYCGLIIGIIGTIIGASIGILACYLLKTYKFIKLPADIYYLETLPVNIQWTDSLIIAFSAILISFLATLYPAYQAAKLNPVEALRYE